MGEQREAQQDDTAAPSVWHLTREQFTLACGTMLAATGVDLLAHLGPTGLVVGGILAFAAARHGQGLYRQVQGLLSPAPRSNSEHKRGHQRSVLDRPLDRFPETLVAEEDEAAPLLLADEDPAFDEPALRGPSLLTHHTQHRRMLVDLAPDVRLDVD